MGCVVSCLKDIEKDHENQKKNMRDTINFCKNFLKRKKYILQTIRDSEFNGRSLNHFVMCFLYKEKSQNDKNSSIEFRFNSPGRGKLEDEYLQYIAVMKYVSILERYPEDISGEDYLRLQIDEFHKNNLNKAN